MYFAVTIHYTIISKKSIIYLKFKLDLIVIKKTKFVMLLSHIRALLDSKTIE